MLVGWAEYGSYYTVKSHTQYGDIARSAIKARDTLRKSARHDTPLTSATQPAPNDAAATAIHYD